MGYYATGEDAGGMLTARWKDSTNKALKYHVVRLAIGTVRQVEYTHAAGDLPIGFIQTAGTFNEAIYVATEGVCLGIVGNVGTINIGDPVVVDYTNSAGTCGKLMSAVSGPHALPSINGTHAGSSGDVSPIPCAYPLKTGSLKTDGTATHGAYLPEAGDGTNLAITGPFDGGNFYGIIDQPIIGISLDKATAPNSEVRIKMARQNDIKNLTTY